MSLNPKTNPMKFTLYGLFIILAFAQFTCEERDCGCVPPPACSTCGGTQVTVKDLSNLDGCSIGLQLGNGDILLPEIRVYVQAPKPEEDPAYFFEFTPGDKLCIGYNEVELMTACMAGKTVFLTCIEKVESTQD